MTALLISLAFGGFVALLAWQAWQVFDVVPDEDRQFLDRPPMGFRAVWPLIEAFVHHFGRFISDEQAAATLRRLRRAGVEYTLSPRQFVAAKFVAAALFAVAAWFCLSSLGKSALAFSLIGGFAGFFYPELWLREAGETRRGALVKSLPFYLDIVTLSVEAGSNLTGGLTQAVQKSSDSPLRREFSRVLRDIRAGRTRAEALRDLAERTGSQPIRNLVSSLIQAERTGASLGPLLRAQAEQLRSQRFQLAEKKAMEAPVKLLGPLVTCIFPCTFLVLGFLVISKGIQEGIGPFAWPPLVWAYQWPGGF